MSPCLTSLPPVVTNPLLKLGADNGEQRPLAGASSADGETSWNPVSQELYAWQPTGEAIEHYVSHRPIRLP